jgi:hypothetical protein
MEPTSRRTVGRLIRASLVLLALVIAGAWLASRLHFRGRGDLPSRIVKTDSLLPGDVQIVSLDSGVSITLQGDRILTGLSPRTIAKIRAGLDSSAAKDTSGLGGSIAQIVKKTVADNINAQMAYPLSQIRDVTFEDSLLVLHSTDGKDNRLFGSAKVDGEKPKFARVDAERFIAAFHARKQATP